MLLDPSIPPTRRAPTPGQGDGPRKRVCIDLTGGGCINLTGGRCIDLTMDSSSDNNDEDKEEEVEEKEDHIVNATRNSQRHEEEKEEEEEEEELGYGSDMSTDSHHERNPGLTLEKGPTQPTPPLLRETGGSSSDNEKEMGYKSDVSTGSQERKPDSTPGKGPAQPTPPPLHETALTGDSSSDDEEELGNKSANQKGPAEPTLQQLHKTALARADSNDSEEVGKGPAEPTPGDSDDSEEDGKGPAELTPPPQLHETAVASTGDADDSEEDGKGPAEPTPPPTTGDADERKPDSMNQKGPAETTPQQLRKTGLALFGVAPTCDSDESDNDDEEPLEMGMTASVLEYTTEECEALFQKLLRRPISVYRRQRTGALSYREWGVALRLMSEESGGVDALESTQAIKGLKVCGQEKLMYGAIRAPLIQEMIRIAHVTPEDRFIDIGCGIGTVVMQMAAMTGCTATGIELDAARYVVGTVLCDDLLKAVREQGGDEEVPGFVDGLQDRIRLINEDIRQHEQEIVNSTCIYFNNHGSWFDEFKVIANKISIERLMASLFAKTAVGTRLIMFADIPHLMGNWFRVEKHVAPAKWCTWAGSSSEYDKQMLCYTKTKKTWTCKKCKHENLVVPRHADYTLIWELCCTVCPHRLRTRANTGTGKFKKG